MKTEPLRSIASIITGVPLSRAKKFNEDVDPERVEVLLSQAVTADGIDDEQLERKEVYGVDESFFTKEGDVVLKASTPFSCVFVDAAHTGLLVTSTCLIIRSQELDETKMRYVAAYLSGDRGLRELRSMSKGTSVKTIKKKDLGDVSIPVLVPEARQKVAEAHERVHALKAFCRSFEHNCDLLLASELDRQLQTADN